MRVAIVHDYLNQYGGAERVLDEIKALFPDAPVYVAIHDPAKMPPAYREWTIKASWMNHLPMVNRKHQMFLPFYPNAFESFDFSGYDLVLSSSSGFAHGIVTGSETMHICYCHSPPRFLWDYHRYADREGLNRIARTLIGPQLQSLRLWDRVSADRTDTWISTSRIVQQRIGKIYGKSSTIIPPPVDTSRFEVSSGKGAYYLMLMRLVGWKRPDIVVDACNKLGLDLVVAGDGRALADLRALAGPNIRFVGRVNDIQMRDLYRDCKALILPSEEDFGITPLEAMAAGRPVIAYGRGGVLDTVVPGITGALFPEQTSLSLMSVLKNFDAERFNPAIIRLHAETFDSKVFRARMCDLIDHCLKEHLSVRSSPAVKADYQLIAV